MANPSSSDVLRQVRRLFGGGASAGLSDAQLLERFAARRASIVESALAAEAAFETLVARHGPMVLGVCRRALTDPGDVEDAFQATFFVLARRAGSVRAGDSLGRWLYGVARRVAARTRARAKRRPARPAGSGGEPAVSGYDPDRAELLAAFDEELGRLPARLQAPVVLCHLEGLTHAEAARRLRCPVGTVSGRLSRARVMLRERLVRRGFSLAVGPLVALLDPGAAGAAIPEPLARASCRTAVRVATGMKTVASASTAAVLAGDVLKEIVMSQLKIAVAASVAFGLAVVGAIAWAQDAGQERGEVGEGTTATRSIDPSGDAGHDRSSAVVRTTIRFPADRAMGVVYTRPAGAGDWPGGDWERLGEAIGEVLVPPGRQVRLELGAGGRADLSPLRRLRPDALRSIRVRDADLRGDALAALAGLTGLEEVDLWQCRVGDAEVRHLAALPRLKSLELAYCQVGDRGLEVLSALRGLERLELSHCRATENGLAFVGRMTSLRSLSLYGCDVEDRGLANLQGLSALESLRLADCLHISDEGLAHLSRLPRLKKLDLESTPITDAGLAHLADSANLEDLSLQGTRIGDAGLASLVKLASLRRLSLPGSISDEGLIHVGALRSLRNLTVRPGRITDRGIAALVGLDRLEQLNLGSGLHGGRVTDASAAVFARLPALKDLWLQHTEVGDEGLESLAAAPRLEYLVLNGNQVTPDGLACLAKFPALTGLDLQGIRGPRGTLRHFADLKGLLHLSIDDSWPGVDGVGEAPGDEGLGYLAGLTRLQGLKLGMPLTDAGMRKLAGLTALRSLVIDNKASRVTDEGLAAVARMKELSNLVVAGRITDRGLAHLEGLRSLYHADLGCRPGAIGREAAAALQARNPAIQLLVYKPPKKDEPPPPEVGRPAPEIRVEAFDGEQISLGKLRGKVVLLYFWATWCTPCLADTPKIKAFVEGLRGEGKDFEAISLSLDDDAHWARRHASRNGLDWPQAWVGEDSTQVSAYAVRSAPHYVVIGREGKLAFAGDRLDAARKAVEDLLSKTSGAAAGR